MDHPWSVAPAPVFSNGTEWDIWRARWCHTCLNDINDDCPIVTELFCHHEHEAIRRDQLQIICLAWEKS